MFISQANAQIQTLHNTIAKGTMQLTGGLNYPIIKTFSFDPTHNVAFGIHYCFKHHYTIGLEYGFLKGSKEIDNGSITWSSSNSQIGLNFNRIDHLYKTQMGKLKIASSLGIAGGSVFSSDVITEDFISSKSNFGQTGYYANVTGAIRFELIRKFFIEVKESGGYLVKNNVKLRDKVQNRISSNNWYTNTEIKLGIFLFIKTLDKCGTCPKW